MENPVFIFNHWLFDAVRGVEAGQRSLAAHAEGSVVYRVVGRAFEFNRFIVSDFDIESAVSRAFGAGGAYIMRYAGYNVISGWYYIGQKFFICVVCFACGYRCCGGEAHYLKKFSSIH